MGTIRVGLCSLYFTEFDAMFTSDKHLSLMGNMCFQISFADQNISAAAVINYNELGGNAL